MIKIHDKIWYVKGVGRDDDLAYMSPYEEGRDGKPLANIVKMQSTGRWWARGYTGLDRHECIPVEGEEAVVENGPIKGFYIGSSVARWSTSNKLFRVNDPRGFTVEVPTDNIATLLHHTTVTNGVVQEECVWGREGNNHILLPVNSEPYLKTLGQMDTLANKLIPIKDLKVGDVVKFFEDKTEYYYAGKLRGTWNVRGRITNRRGYSYPYDQSTVYSDWVEVQDEKWVHVFLMNVVYSTKKYRVETPAKPKIVEILKNEPRALNVEEIGWYCPARVHNRTKWSDHYSYYEAELIKLEEKKC